MLTSHWRERNVRNSSGLHRVRRNSDDARLVRLLGVGIVTGFHMFCAMTHTIIFILILMHRTKVWCAFDIHWH